MVTFSKFTSLQNLTWQEVKALELPLHYEDEGNYFYIWCIDTEENIYTCDIWKVEMPWAVALVRNQAENDLDLIEFKTMVGI